VYSRPKDCGSEGGGSVVDAGKQKDERENDTLPCDVCKRQCFSALLPGSSLFVVKGALNAA